MSKHRTLADFPPPVDGSKLRVAKPNWICAPVGVHTKSSPRELNNYNLMVSLLATPGQDVSADFEEVEFAHWNGRVVNAFCRPNSPAHKMAQHVRTALETTSDLQPWHDEVYGKVGG